MLKWTNAATQATTLITTNRLQNVIASPTTSGRCKRRRDAISHKENIVETSPINVNRQWTSNAFLVGINDTPSRHNRDEDTPRSVVRRNKRRKTEIGIAAAAETGKENETFESQNHGLSMFRRRHSIDMSNTNDYSKYARTLPLCSPLVNATTLLPSGQELALRGLWLDPILAKRRYCNSTDNLLQEEMEVKSLRTLEKPMGKQTLRYLEDEFSEINHGTSKEENSIKMDDEALDKLIDAILDSACKADKKKKLSRKSFNLRRRSLLKNNGSENERTENLSPTYTAGLDPANDLNLLTKTVHRTVNESIGVSTADNEDSKYLRKTPINSIKKRHSLLAVTPPAKSHTHESKRKRLHFDLQNCTELGVALPSLYV